MRECYIVEGVRSPIGKKNGSLQYTRTDEVAGMVLEALAERSKVDTDLIDYLTMGCVMGYGDQAYSFGRRSLLLANYPIHVAACTIDQACGSSLQGMMFGTSMIQNGDMDIVVSAGAENMSRYKMGILNSAEQSPKMDKYNFIGQGLAAEVIAERYGITREDVDKLSAESHAKAAAARENGWFKNEIVPIEVYTEDGGTKIFSEDECIRPGTTVEKLSQLKPVFKEDGIIHAGNSSQISAGASALMIMSGEKCKELGITPKFRVVAHSVIGTDPHAMLEGPIPSTRMALKKAGLSINDIGVYEVNEAFAPVPLAWLKELDADPAKMNPQGSAIALGHPLGCTGTRLVISLVNEMERMGVQYGLATLCEAWGVGNCCIVEKVN